MTITDERQRAAIETLYDREREFRAVVGLLGSIGSTCHTIVQLTPQLGTGAEATPPPAVVEMRDDCIRELARLLEHLAGSSGITTTRSKTGLSIRAASSQVNLHPAQQHCVAGRYGGPTFIEALCNLIDGTLFDSIPPLFDCRVSGALEAHLLRMVGEDRHALPIGAGVALTLTGLLNTDDLGLLYGAVARECRQINVMHGAHVEPKHWEKQTKDERASSELDGEDRDKASGQNTSGSNATGDSMSWIRARDAAKRSGLSAETIRVHARKHGWEFRKTQSGEGIYPLDRLETAWPGRRFRSNLP